MPGGGREGTRRGSVGMHGAQLKAGGQGTRGERTRNMLLMSVTLEVSKLSGWLKAGAYCAESQGGHAMQGGEVRAGRWEGLG